MDRTVRTLLSTSAWLAAAGNTLPHDVWLTRHRWLVALLAASGVGMFVFALLEGYSVGHSMLEGGILEVFALAAWVMRDHQRFASVLSSIGLISVASVSVHVSGGYIEAHFVFFVVIILLTLYEDWVPFLLAAAYVFIHHGAVGLTDPGSVYNHPDAIAHPIKWALIHAGLVGAAGFAGVVAWRLNENERLGSERAYQIARTSERSMADAQELAGIGGFEHDLRTGEAKWSEQHFRIFGFDPANGPPAVEEHLAHFEKHDREDMLKALDTAIERREPLDRQYRYHHPDGSTRVIHARGRDRIRKRPPGAVRRHEPGRDRTRASARPRPCGVPRCSG